MHKTKEPVWILLFLAFFSNILYMAGLAALQVRPRLQYAHAAHVRRILSQTHMLPSTFICV